MVYSHYTSLNGTLTHQLGLRKESEYTGIYKRPQPNYFQPTGKLVRLIFISQKLVILFILNLIKYMDTV